MNNHIDKKLQEPARNWEKAYVDYMKRYIKDDKPDFLEIAFSSERSIEDELENVSYGEVSTVTISYVLMFVYIAVALGEADSWSRLFVRLDI